MREKPEAQRSLEKEVAPAGKQRSELLILSWEPGLGMCWYRGKLESPVRWGAQGHLCEDKEDGWHPAHTAFWPSISHCFPQTAHVFGTKCPSKPAFSLTFPELLE